MADDTGDPGLAGTRHFGYAAIAVERRHMPQLTRIASEFRVRHSMFTEARAKVTHGRFRDLVEQVAAACEGEHLLSGACLIIKEKYEGPYLVDDPDRPADAHFLRNFTVRHTLETLFQGEAFGDHDTIEVVLDRVDYSDTQVMNLRDYLNSELAKEGKFLFPQPRWITHADSSYVEGLQVAHHIAELTRSIGLGDADEIALACAQRFLRVKTLVRSRGFVFNREVADVLGRRTRRRLEARSAGEDEERGPETISQVTRPR